MVLVLSEADLDPLLDLGPLLDVVEDAFLAQGEGAVERPERLHYPLGTGLDPDDPEAPLGTGLIMPAYVHGADYAATKLLSVHEGSAESGQPTGHAQVAVVEADTGRAAAFMAGMGVTNARTGCIGGVAVRALVEGPVTLGVIGAGNQGRWQTLAIDAAVGIETTRIYSPSDSKEVLAAELENDHAISATAVESPRVAVEGADVVVTATPATEPVFPGDTLAPGATVVAIGAFTPEMQELDATTMGRASRVYADVPDEVAGTGDVIETGFDPDQLVPLATLLAGEDEPAPEELVVVDSVGSAVLDAAAAEFALDRAVEAGVGTEVEL